MERLLSLEQVSERVGMKRTSIYKLVKSGEMPCPVKVGPKASRWLESEVEDFINSRPRVTDLVS